MSAPPPDGSASNSITLLEPNGPLAPSRNVLSQKNCLFEAVSNRLASATISCHGQVATHITPAKEATQPRSGILRLPYEIVSCIIQRLPLRTIFGLAQSCRHFEYLIRDNNLCKMLLKVCWTQSLCFAGKCTQFNHTDIVTVESSLFG